MSNVPTKEILDWVVATGYTADDYQREIGPVKTRYEIRNDFVDEKSARAMTALIIQAYENAKQGIYTELDYSKIYAEVNSK